MKPRNRKKAQLEMPWRTTIALPSATHAEEPTERWSLARVKRWLRERIADGVACPCCGQNAKIYKRSLRTGWTYALALIATAPLKEMDEHGYLHATRHFNAVGKGTEAASGVAISGDWQLLRHWKLIEGTGAGWWRITDTGMAFLRREIRVPSEVLLYNNAVVGFGPRMIRVDEADGDEFDLDKIMEPGRFELPV